MNRSIPSLLLAVTASFATVPVSFSSGTPAKADDVNKNFAALDSAIQKKAESSLVSVLQSAVSTKADQTKLDDLTKTVATKASLTELNTKKDSAWIVSTINGKIPTGTLSAANNLKDVADPAAARTNLGLGALAAKASLAASDVGTLDSASIKSRFLSSMGVANLGGDLILGSYAIRRVPGSEWLLGATPTEIKFGSTASGTEKTISLYSGSTDSIATFTSNHISLRRNTAINGSLLVNSGTAGGGSATLFGSGLSIDRGLSYVGTSDSTQTLILQTNETRFMDQSNTLKLASIKKVGSKGNLYVSGSITTAAGSTVPDYVFEPGYKLASLSEVEAYTKEHKHLPEVPSATEIEQGGMDLAKMNLLLLKKVEELTLHTIELEKRMKAFESAQKP